MKIIIVDDENDALGNFLFHIVEEKDIEYKMFRNDPLQSIDYVQKNSVDAAFLDINMPGINGVDLAEKLIKINADLKIVFISGYIQNEKPIKKRLKGNLIGFCCKPYSADTLFEFIRQISDSLGSVKQVFLRTFGAFELMVDNKAVKFTSAKSKELLALLTEKNGAHLTMGEAVSFLWPEKSKKLSSILYRDAVWRLRQTLKDYSVSSLVTFTRAKQIINKDGIECDYWNFLCGINFEQYCGSYLPNYDWSVDTQNMLDNLFNSKYRL